MPKVPSPDDDTHKGLPICFRSDILQHQHFQFYGLLEGLEVEMPNMIRGRNLCLTLVELKAQHGRYLLSQTRATAVLDRFSKAALKASTSRNKNVFVRSYVKFRRNAPRAINPP